MAISQQAPIWQETPVQVQRGDIWQLGRHRLACLDAFDPETYERLLQDIRPHAIITDPPYGMRLDANFQDMQGGHTFNQDKGVTGGNQYATVIGDFKDFDASHLMRYFHDIPEQFWFGANYYSSTLGDTMHQGCWLVWDKRLSENLDKMFGSGFELIWSRKKHKQDVLRHLWAGPFGTEQELRGQRKRVHPTQKPLPLIEDIINRYTKPQQVILDMFLGSGTTIIASERTNRTTYGCELSEDYCQIAISRWQNLTGQTATLLSRSLTQDAA